MLSPASEAHKIALQVPFQVGSVTVLLQMQLVLATRTTLVMSTNFLCGPVDRLSGSSVQVWSKLGRVRAWMF